MPNPTHRRLYLEMEPLDTTTIAIFRLFMEILKHPDTTIDASHKQRLAFLLEKKLAEETAE